MVDQILALPYQPAYVPFGFDAAFPGDSVVNDPPAEDYTSGSVSPDSPPVRQVLLHPADGAPFFAEVALRPGPQVVPSPGRRWTYLVTADTRSGPRPFLTLTRTLRKHRAGILGSQAPARRGFVSLRRRSRCHLSKIGACRD